MKFINVIVLIQCTVHRDWMIKQVKEIYGRGKTGGWVVLVSKNTSNIWGDNIILGLICFMWGVRVSILLSESCAEICLRHNLEWPECDFLNYHSTESIFRYAQLQQCLLGS